MLLSFTSKAESGFNPRVLTGGRDSRRIVRTEPQRGFNPRVLTGGRDFYAQLSFELQVFQSTRPHGRTRLAFILSWYILPVSIHGPHGRTRLPIHCIRHCCHVSIHASSREDATFAGGALDSAGQFQSTRPRGRTRLYSSLYRRRPNVSIHASSREDATPVQFPELYGLLFQSTRPRGRTRHGMPVIGME